MSADFKRLAWKAYALSVLLAVVGVTVAMAASGGLDLSFGGGDGYVLTDIAGAWSDELNAIARDSAGKILAVGSRYDPVSPTAITRDIVVARYESDGDPDLSFAGDGSDYVDLGGVDEAMDVKTAAGGKFVISGQTCEAGRVNCDVVVARVGSDGEKDPNFNGGNEKYIDFNGGDNGTHGGLAVLSDGKIVVAGSMWNGTDYDFAVYRLKANGALDRSFGGDGRARIGFGTSRVDRASDMIVRDGNVIVVGMSCNTGVTDCKIAVARLTSSGAPDTTFSTDGKVMTRFSARQGALAVAGTADGKIVVAGMKETSTGLSAAVVRYNADGTLDATFSGDGKQTIAHGTTMMAYDVLVEASGKIVLTGGTFDGADHDMFMARLKPGGGLDASFGENGISHGTLVGYEVAYDVLRLPSGKYLVGGAAEGGPESDFILVRVLP